MTTFQRNQNKRTYTIYYNVNCKSKCTIPLMESWRSWWNVLNVRLAETELKLRIKDHRKDVLKLNTIPAFRHVAQRDHDFDTDAKFTTIEQLQNAKLSKESITEIHKELLNKNTRNSTSERTSESTNIILFIFSVQLAFTRKCISISKIREIECNQRCI